MKMRSMFLFNIELERTKIRILFTLLHAVLLMKQLVVQLFGRGARTKGRSCVLVA